MAEFSGMVFFHYLSSVMVVRLWMFASKREGVRGRPWGKTGDKSLVEIRGGSLLSSMYYRDFVKEINQVLKTYKEIHH